MTRNFLHRAQSSQTHRSFSGFIQSAISRSGSPDANCPLLTAAKPIEEETLPKYSPQIFYGVKLGEKLNNGRYEIITKLGYGMTATVWLARDTQAGNGKDARKYVTVKININSLPTDFLNSRREIARVLKQTNRNHPGYNHVRFMLETFAIRGRYGEHLCVVYDVLREPLDECQRRLPNKLFKSEHLRILLRSLLQGLDYMHSECHVVHTDLKPDNVMMGLGPDPNAVLDKFVGYTMSHPPPRKPPEHHDQHTIYKSSSDLLLVEGTENSDCIDESVLVSAKITDIGLAEWGDKGPQHKAIQTNAFTCPEVLLGAGWSYPADIWNLGVMMWDMIKYDGLFDDIDTSPGHYKGEQHLALMIVLMGPPPKALLDRGLKTSKYFDYDKEKDEWVFRNQKYVEKYQDCVSWEKSIKRMTGNNKTSFIDFARKMICWEPAERWTAAQLLTHPWLQKAAGSVVTTPQDYASAKEKIREGIEEDIKLGLSRASTTASFVSSPGISEIPTTGSSRYGSDSPPVPGIVYRKTDSCLDMADLRPRLPRLTNQSTQ